VLVLREKLSVGATAGVLLVLAGVYLIVRLAG
jgi:drug/metabolite transporter (DMT)-like permease